MGPETGSAPAPIVEAESEPSAEAVAAYLLEHPDFLIRHPHLLKTLTPPARWTGDEVVDIQKFMVDTLKDEMEGLRTCAQEVIETSRSNMANQTRTHAAVLSLLSANDIERLMRIISDDLPMLLDVDVAIIALDIDDLPQLADGEIRRLATGEVDRLIGPTQEAALFAVMDEALTHGCGVFNGVEGLVKSAALARLRMEAVGESAGMSGLLALGSRHEGMFHSRQGTELLRFLARVVERCLGRALAASR